MKNIFLIFTILFSASCKKISGLLEVNDHLSFISNNQNDYLVEGIYKAKIKITDDKINIKVKNKYQNAKILIKTAENIKLPALDLKKIHQQSRKECRLSDSCRDELPSLNKEFILNEGDINQPFSLHGKAQIKRTISETQESLEDCVVLPNLQECQLNERWRNNYSMCQNGLPGVRRVVYNNFNYNLTFNLGFIQDGTAKASFNSLKKATFREYSFVGSCLLR